MDGSIAVVVVAGEDEVTATPIWRASGLTSVARTVEAPAPQGVHLLRLLLGPCRMDWISPTFSNSPRRCCHHDCVASCRRRSSSLRAAVPCTRNPSSLASARRTAVCCAVRASVHEKSSSGDRFESAPAAAVLVADGTERLLLLFLSPFSRIGLLHVGGSGGHLCLSRNGPSSWMLLVAAVMASLIPVSSGRAATVSSRDWMLSFRRAMRCCVSFCRIRMRLKQA
jgi:hypothetical protein